MQIIERLESEVRGYIRDFPAIFDTAKGAILRTADGEEYLDFFAGAGALNYGHNHPALQQPLLDYIAGDGVTHSLDMGTRVKSGFLEAFEAQILKPRKLDYKVQFPGPTGTNAVEAALKLARKVTGRTEVVCFTNGFHGMTLGSLAVTGNAFKRQGAGLPLSSATSMPFAGYLDDDASTLGFLEQLISDRSSGLDLPAAFIVETIQAEGGVNVCSMEWLQGAARIAREHGALFIVDDIQVGCGRTGPFFSFEDAGIEPDLICLSKSISGYGLPMALTLIKPEWDQWEPGEHNGTFRGHNPAFVTATAALELFWKTPAFAAETQRKGAIAERHLNSLQSKYPVQIADIRGRGLIQGIEFSEEGTARKVADACFSRNLLIETAGATGNVLKILPPLVLTDDELHRGLEIMSESIAEVCGTTFNQRKPAMAQS